MFSAKVTACRCKFVRGTGPEEKPAKEQEKVGWAAQTLLLGPTDGTAYQGLSLGSESVSDSFAKSASTAREQIRPSRSACASLRCLAHPPHYLQLTGKARSEGREVHRLGGAGSKELLERRHVLGDHGAAVPQGRSRVTLVCTLRSGLVLGSRPVLAHALPIVANRLCRHCRRRGKDGGLRRAGCLLVWKCAGRAVAISELFANPHLGPGRVHCTGCILVPRLPALPALPELGGGVLAVELGMLAGRSTALCSVLPQGWGARCLRRLAPIHQGPRMRRHGRLERLPAEVVGLDPLPRPRTQFEARGRACGCRAVQPRRARSPSRVPAGYLPRPCRRRHPPLPQRSQGCQGPLHLRPTLLQHRADAAPGQLTALNVRVPRGDVDGRPPHPCGDVGLVGAGRHEPHACEGHGRDEPLQGLRPQLRDDRGTSAARLQGRGSRLRREGGERCRARGHRTQRRERRWTAGVPRPLTLRRPSKDDPTRLPPGLGTARRPPECIACPAGPRCAPGMTEGEGPRMPNMWAWETVGVRTSVSENTA